MNLYRISRVLGDLYPTWEGTLSEAHEALRQCRNMPDACIELLDLDVSKGGMLHLLNSRGNPPDVSPSRTWMLTPRGGLKEVPNDA